MSIFEKNRWEIWNQTQHPFRHSIADFAYTNDALNGMVSTLEGAMDYIFAVLYPNSMPSVADPASLPAVGNTINDYRVVEDDGDGKQAGYRWEQREGDVAAKWYKIYDLDWGMDSILSGFITKTQDVYVFKHGYDDIDSDGNLIAGTYAGQHIYGGESAGTNLTLFANAGDGTGADTGYVQVDDNFRPAQDSTLSCGTTGERWLKVWTDEITIDTMTITGGSILDSSGAISFGDEDISTTGSISSGSLTLSAGSITDSSGTIDFGDEDLQTTGGVTAGASSFGSGTSIGTLSFSDGSITDSGGAISFGDEDLSTTGTLGAGVTTVDQLNVDDTRIDGNTLSIVTADTDLNIQANGTGVVAIGSAMTTIGQTVTGTIDVTGSVNADNLTLDGNTLSSTDADGNIILSPDGDGLVELTSGLFPTTTSTEDIGKTGNVWNKLWIDGSIGDGTNEILISTLLSLRSVLSGAGAGDTLFYNDGTGLWEASHPDSEIAHSEIDGITTGDAGHTQFAMLNGRSGGQTLSGGTDASDVLTLQSTSHGTKGDIAFADKLRPVTNQDTDIGDATHMIHDLYIYGEAMGLRFQNATTAGAPSASAQTIGRTYFNTDNNKVYVDTGGAWALVGFVEKYYNQDAVNWDGSTKTHSYDVSGSITDARQAVWRFMSNADNFEDLGVKLEKTSTHVTVTAEVNLPSGTYTLLGVG